MNPNQTPKIMKRRTFNQKLFLASLGLTLLDVEMLSDYCNCGGECYKMADLMVETDDLNSLRKIMCLYITNEKESGNWDALEQLVIYTEPFINKNTNQFIDWKNI